MNPKRWRPELLVLIIAALATRFWNLFSPGDVVFDEVYFKAFAAHYLDGHYYFDIHPPLGKLLLAGFGRVAGLSPDAMLNGSAVTLRLLPAAAGALLVPLVWAILRRLGASRPFAFLGALLILADNALLVESRFILMDSMLLLFGLGAVYLYLIARDTTPRWRPLWLTLAAICGGASASIKWTGLSSLAIIGLIWLWDQYELKTSWKRRLSEISILMLAPVLIYTSVFWVHFHFLPASGDGDAFMSLRFQQTLAGNPNYNPQTHLTFLDKFIQLNKEMLSANQTLTATHPYGSRWYTWPVEQRPIYYWEGPVESNNNQGNIYLLGNPVIWWGVLLAIASGLILARVRHRSLRPATLAALAIAAAAYLINLLPFVAVARVMFLYHYFFSFIFSLIFAVMLWNDLAASDNKPALSGTRERYAFGIVVILVIVGFIFFAPLSYGTPLSPQGLQARIWLPSWR